MKKEKPRVALATLGCKVNQCESASLQGCFEDGGARIVPFSHEADIYVINTCAVTAKASFQSRQTIRRALRENPRARVVVTGCYAQVASEEILRLTDRPLCIIGNGMKDRLVEIALRDEGCDLEMYLSDMAGSPKYLSLPMNRFAGRTRAFLKIQDGCDRFCSYCIVPYARGGSRSLSPAEALSEAEALVHQGAREIVLTGIHLGVYGHDFSPPSSLPPLVLELASRHPRVRLRLSSLEPAEISDDLLRLMVNLPSVMPHLHIPLQSGDDDILRRMNRRYTVREFVAVVEKVHGSLPHAAVGVDVLTGFPGESEVSFRETKKILEDLPIAYFHVFPYSKRPGTAAAVMKGHLPRGVKEERAAILREVDHMKRTAFYGRNMGAIRPVLAEGARNRFKLMRGYTDNYIPVHFEAPERLANEVVNVALERLMDTNVFGRRIEGDIGSMELT